MKINSDIAIALGEVQTLAFLVNEHTDYAVFMSFYGHVKSLRFQITESKDNYDTELTLDDFYLHKGELTLRKLKTLKLRLKKILRDKNVDFNELNYTIRNERDYHLL